MVLSEDKDIKKKLFIIPIATSWTAVAAEYVLDQKQYQDDKGGIKQWRPFKSDETHASEDAHWADTKVHEGHMHIDSKDEYPDLQ